MMQQWNRASARAWSTVALALAPRAAITLTAPTHPSALSCRTLHSGAAALGPQRGPERKRVVEEKEVERRTPRRDGAAAAAESPFPRSSSGSGGGGGGKGRHEHSQRKQRRAKQFANRQHHDTAAAPENNAAAQPTEPPRVHPPRTVRPAPELRRSDLRHPSSAFFQPAQKEWYQQPSSQQHHQQQPQQRELSPKEEEDLILTEADEAEYAEGAAEDDAELDDDEEAEYDEAENGEATTTPVASAPQSAADSAPSQTLSFRELGVASHVHTKLPGAFDVHSPTGIQCAAIPFLIRSAPQQFRDRDDGSAAKRGTPQGLNAEDAAHQARREKLRRMAGLPRDMVIQDMTGSGKTLAYVLPMLTLVDNFKTGHLQGVVIAPTRELAVQIFRVLRRLNDTRNAGARRRKHPVTIRLAIGHVTEAYAEDVRHNPAHIIVATPDTFAALALGIPAKPDPRSRRSTKDQAQKFEVRPSVNLRHVRMLVCDEVDHLLLPATAPTIERILQSLTNTPSHGSMHRLGRVVLVSAALSPRVELVASKYLYRVVTATSEGLLDGWLPPNRMLKDRWLLKKGNKPQQQGDSTKEGATAAATENGDDAEDAEPETTLPRPRNLSHLSPLERAAYEEADDFVSEADEEAEDHASMLELKAQDQALLRARKREADIAAGVPPNLLDEAAEAALAAESHVIKAEDFVLPGLRRPVATEEVDEEGKAEQPVAVPLHAALPLPAAGDAAAIGGQVAGSVPSLPGVVSTPPPGAAADEPPLPSASAAAVRFLPSSMRHLAVHVGPQSKPLLHAGSTDEERAQAMAARVDLIAQVHAALRPRVAIVFFTRAADALACAADLRARKRLRVEVLLSGGGLRAADRLRAIESVLHGSVDLVLATDMAARGLDLRGLSHVVNFDLPPTALDYVHRAGRVERLGGARGCTVVNIVRDLREASATPVAPPVDPEHPVFPLPKRKGTFAGAQVPLLRRLAGQLHLEMPSLTLRAGKLVPIEVQQRGTHIKTPPTPPKRSKNATTDSPTDAAATVAPALNACDATVQATSVPTPAAS